MLMAKERELKDAVKEGRDRVSNEDLFLFFVLFSRVNMFGLPSIWFVFRVRCLHDDKKMINHNHLGWSKVGLPKGEKTG